MEQQSLLRVFQAAHGGCCLVAQPVCTSAFPSQEMHGKAQLFQSRKKDTGRLSVLGQFLLYFYNITAELMLQCTVTRQTKLSGFKNLKNLISAGEFGKGLSTHSNDFKYRSIAKMLFRFSQATLQTWNFGWKTSIGGTALERS